ncbi:MAG: UDP-N-acetylglucosamine 1-carboxyvinyltransferase [Bacteroides sp.]|nr:UDP-N-acetylglucosamine 1-carboxyvinyltransferase [Bacteroides sp.]MCM1086115.1 UDP-N-acetylglucosamine 1-carboxyvinyltransferase [Bacteroides sp.]
MSSFSITGGKRLCGCLTPQGAKNEALQVICACLLTKERVTIHNVPLIRDVLKLVELLQSMGVKVERPDEHTFVFQADDIDAAYLHTEDFRQKTGSLRGSVMTAGPLLARIGHTIVPQPGGDKIGRRKLDTHFTGFENLGATVSYNQNEHAFYVSGHPLQGRYMLLDEASVTGTANIIMAAVLARGTTVIFNAACEPYVLQLCRMLVRMGAQIRGLGSNLLQIEGVGELHGTEHTLLPDMIEVGSFIGMAAMTRSEITIRNVDPLSLGLIPQVFGKLGVHTEFKGDDLYVPAQDHYTIENSRDGSILTISDAPWPGFTPDLISIALVTATQAKGSVLIHQKMFESRLFFVDNLISMGAKIILCDPHRATVIGLNRESPLQSISMVSPDIRAGVSLLIAAMSAEGTSTIHNIEQIDRGYERIDERLNHIGAEIRRIS